METKVKVFILQKPSVSRTWPLTKVHKLALRKRGAERNTAGAVQH